MRLFAAFTFLIGSTAIACADSLWDHNGSIMHLQQDGDRRFMYYAQPRQGMVEAGVTPGTLFFDGVKRGEEYFGTARVFSSRCPTPMTFSISGPVYQDGRIVLEGMRPVFKNCRATGEMKFDRLEFTFIENIKPELLDGVAAEASADAADVPAVVDAQSDTVVGPQSTPNTAKVDVAALLRAGLEGDATAFKELARIFANGEGVAQSTERSLNFLKKAGELGDREARLEWSRKVLDKASSSKAEIDQANAWLAGQEYSVTDDSSKAVAESASDTSVSKDLSAGNVSGRSPVLLMSSDTFDYFSCPSLLDQDIIEISFGGVSRAVKEYNSQSNVDVKMQAPDLNHCSVQIGRPGTLFDGWITFVFFVSRDHFECSVRGDCYGDLAGYQAEVMKIRGGYQFVANTNRTEDMVFLCAKGGDVRLGPC